MAGERCANSGRQSQAGALPADFRLASLNPPPSAERLGDEGAFGRWSLALVTTHLM